MTMPLEGIRVVDWTIWQQGPVASVMLGDLGADVIKVEERVGGDPGRGVLRAQGLDLTRSPELLLRGQQPQQEEPHRRPEEARGRRDRAAARGRADVFVQNFRQGVAARLGLDAATLRARNPRLIYASATGYGPEGPESGAPSFDYLGLARSGIMLVGRRARRRAARDRRRHRRPDGRRHARLRRPRRAARARARPAAARRSTPRTWARWRGSRASASSARLMLGRALPRQSRRFATNPLWNHYRCADGEWLALSMLQADRYWARFCDVLGIPEAATDERFATMLDAHGQLRRLHRAARRDLRPPAARRVAPAPRRGRRLHRLASSTRSTTSPTTRRCRPTAT